MNWIERTHDRHIFTRRVEALSEGLARLIPPDSDVLDIGSGDGRVCSLLAARRRDLHLTAVDTLQREKSFFPVSIYDGRRLPFDADRFDGVTFVDVLHHVDPMENLLREGARVSRGFVVIKDHLCGGALDRAVLRFMDNVGNAHHGVASIYNYKSRAAWDAIFESLGLSVEKWIGRLSLYPVAIGWLFERNLHFMARLAKVPAREK